MVLLLLQQLRVLPASLIQTSPRRGKICDLACAWLKVTLQITEPCCTLAHPATRRIHG